MQHPTITQRGGLRRRLLGIGIGAGLAALGLVLGAGARAAVPGIVGDGNAGSPSYSLTAAASYITQPDGQMVYSWGYGCRVGANVTFAPATIPGNCPTMQVPGPTLVVTQGDTVTITLTNNLPPAAGSTSILFPGFVVSAAPTATQPSGCSASTPGAQGLLTMEAAPGCSVTYVFTANTEGTHAYYSGTQGDLQVEMGLYGAIVVVPKAGPAACAPSGGTSNDQARAFNKESDYRLSKSAYTHAATCYDREYLFQFSEMDPRIHHQAQAQVLADQQAATHCAQPTGCLSVETEPYHPAYFMINGRSMPDDLDPNYAYQYPHQPYNGNPHMHPGEVVLLRVIGTGRWQHPFHEHGNHVRVLARDGNLMLSPTDPTKLAGPLLFTTTTTPGIALDGLFYWTGKGLNWDVYGHGFAGDASACVPDANGYFTSDPTARNYYEWCGDHGKALEANPTGQVGKGGPVTLPFANILTNGTWYGGSPYLGPDANVRAVGPTGTTPPSGTVGNSPTDEAGFAFMWHSHNEREITTNNIFPGGMMMMMLVDPWYFAIDETK